MDNKAGAGKTQAVEPCAYEERNPVIEQTMRDLGNMLKERMPLGWGFVLQIMSYGPGGSLFYISTVEREDMIKCMKETIERIERIEKQ